MFSPIGRGITVDVGTVTYVSEEANCIVLCVLGFTSLAYVVKEFEITMNRLGCYGLRYCSHVGGEGSLPHIQTEREHSQPKRCRLTALESRLRALLTCS